MAQNVLKKELQRMMEKCPQCLTPSKIYRYTLFGKNRIYDLLRTGEIPAFVYNQSVCNRFCIADGEYRFLTCRITVNLNRIITVCGSGIVYVTIQPDFCILRHTHHCRLYQCTRSDRKRRLQWFPVRHTLEAELVCRHVCLGIYIVFCLPE